jgi:hypothetical protein
MDISIFGYKLNMEVLILIGIVYLILVGHTVCSCCKFNKKEGFDNTAPLTQPMPSPAVSNEVSTPAVPSTNSSDATGDSPEPTKLPSSVNSGDSKKKEGFVGANTNYGESSSYSLTHNNPVNTSNWGYPDLVIVPGQPIPKGAQELIDRPNQSLPLPEGQLSLFDNMPFSPNCCPNTYSSSMGCACMNTNTYNYLITRSGNNVPYSEY